MWTLSIFCLTVVNGLSLSVVLTKREPRVGQLAIKSDNVSVTVEAVHHIERILFTVCFSVQAY